MSENELLELAKKCGAIVKDVVPYDNRPEYRTVTFNVPTFIAFASMHAAKVLEEAASELWRRSYRNEGAVDDLREMAAEKRKLANGKDMK